ncbi:hypothetical protein PF004_g26095 [Phytophthora fragariae]|uniref:Uncharacterized protein n=1 Tax=Phytophthora fragariae TaxID=53985 RepID=A0A6G0MPN1_9STRA|nr:hypothetical protein PF004_g26095 [Phytophthora fragariae]KAE9286297.1 hypothetical protein PF008_g26696 [Phytophthora fragariae]
MASRTFSVGAFPPDGCTRFPTEIAFNNPGSQTATFLVYSGQA